jgi:ribonuclease E
MTRKRIGTGLLEAFTTECPQCHGRGYELHDMPVPSQRHSDGGTRESRPRVPRANAQVGPEESTGETDPADITTVEVASERPAVRSRRGGGRSRSAAANREHDAAEPQDQPAGVS